MKIDTKKSKKERYAIIAVILFILIIGGLFLYQYVKFKKFISAEQDDICKTPPGYTDQQWREHMGHHPDRYAQCLGG